VNRLVTCLVVLLLLSGSAHAQTRPYNPYAPAEEFASPVTPDGKLNWPPFFKSATMEAKYHSYFEMGSCVGTKAAVTEKLRLNKVDVNELAETSITGVAMGVQSGIVKIRDASGSPIAIVMHPSGVSKVSITGTMPLNQLRVGMMLRLLSSVDEHGVGLKPLSEVEVVTLSADILEKPVEASHVQTIVGKISRLYGTGRLRLQVDPGKLHRLALAVKQDSVVDVNAHSIQLIAPGDFVQSTGHIYIGEGSLGAQTLFASEITVAKSYAASPGVIAHRKVN
jgi:hypothetical protein